MSLRQPIASTIEYFIVAPPAVPFQPLNYSRGWISRLVTVFATGTLIYAFTIFGLGLLRLCSSVSWRLHSRFFR